MHTVGTASSDSNELPKAKEKRCKNRAQNSKAMSVPASDLRRGQALETDSPVTVVGSTSGLSRANYDIYRTIAEYRIARSLLSLQDRLPNYLKDLHA